MLGGLGLAAATAIYTLAGSWTVLRQVHRAPKGQRSPWPLRTVALVVP